jgi:hypothetical protein
VSCHNYIKREIIKIIGAEYVITPLLVFNVMILAIVNDLHEQPASVLLQMIAVDFRVVGVSEL